MSSFFKKFNWKRFSKKVPETQTYDNVYINQRDTTLLMNDLYFPLFGSTCTSSVAPSNKLYNAFGAFVQATLAAVWMYIRVDVHPLNS